MPKTNTKEYRKERDYFAYTRIVKRVNDKGVMAATDEYQTLSSAIHPSEWGTQFYAHRSSDYREMNWNLGREFDSEKYFGLGLIANKVLPNPILAFSKYVSV